jgi:O6-methylguanine-DNA--protein-cysteine methyltransferase
MGSSGALTGYAGGLDRKRALLTLEARHANDLLLELA